MPWPQCNNMTSSQWGRGSPGAFNVIMRGVHDLGGLAAGPVDRGEHALSFFEQRVDGMMRLLMHPDSGHFTVDAMRRAIESLPPEAYHALSYYERWLCAMHRLVLERGLVSEAELAARVQSLGAGNKP